MAELHQQPCFRKIGYELRYKELEMKGEYLPNPSAQIPRSVRYNSRHRINPHRMFEARLAVTKVRTNHDQRKAYYSPQNYQSEPSGEWHSPRRLFGPDKQVDNRRCQEQRSRD